MHFRKVSSAALLHVSMLAGCAGAPQPPAKSSNESNLPHYYELQAEATQKKSVAHETCPIADRAYIGRVGLVCLPSYRLERAISEAEQLARAAACDYWEFKPRNVELTFDDALQALVSYSSAAPYMDMDPDRKLAIRNEAEKVIEAGRKAFKEAQANPATCPNKPNAQIDAQLQPTNPIWANPEAAHVGKVLESRGIGKQPVIKGVGVGHILDVRTKRMIDTVAAAAKACENAYSNNIKRGTGINSRTWCAQPDIPRHEWRGLMQLGVKPVPQFIQFGAQSLKVIEVGVLENVDCKMDAQNRSVECVKGSGSLEVTALIPGEKIPKMKLFSLPEPESTGPRILTGDLGFIPGGEGVGFQTGGNVSVEEEYVTGEVRPAHWEKVKMVCPRDGVMLRQVEQGRAFYSCATAEQVSVDVQVDVNTPEQRDIRPLSKLAK